MGAWEYSAGTSEDDSEWVVLDQNDWTYLGSHPHEFEAPCAFDGDANLDGSVDVSDVVMIVGAILESNTEVDELIDKAWKCLDHTYKTMTN